MAHLTAAEQLCYDTVEAQYIREGVRTRYRLELVY
jgi:hypothetical protein